MTLDNLIRRSLAVAITTQPVRRQQLFALLPPDTFKGPAIYYKLGRFFATDSMTENYGDIAAATGLDAVALVGLTGEDESYRPLHEHLVRLLSARQAAAQAGGEDVAKWAAAITAIMTSQPASVSPVDMSPADSLFISATDMLLAPVKVEPLLGKVIERGCTGQIFGPSGGGKTFVALDMSCAVGTGGEWNGNKCEQGLVLYFAGEGLSGLRRRVKAWSKHNSAPDLSNLCISRSVVSLDAAGIRKVIVEVRQLEESAGRKVGLIVIDTLARHIQGDENSTQNMSEFVQSVDGLRDAFPGSTAIIVHHTGNNAETTNRSRGSSALKAACDFEIQCDKGLLTYTKVKDGEQPEPVEFKLVPVEIGLDEDGEPITSCIVKYGERSAKNKEVTLTATEKQLLCLVKDYPKILSGDLRSVFYDKRRELEPDAKTNTLKNSFLRAYQGLLEKSVIVEVNNVVTLSKSEPSHVTSPSQIQVYDGWETVTNVTPLYRGCDGVTPPTPATCDEIPVFDEADFAGVL